MKCNCILFGSLLMLLLASACKKESGFLPDYDKGEPYYNDISFEHQWSQSVERGNEGNVIWSIKKTSNMILLVRKEAIHAFSIMDGEPLWVYAPHYENWILGDFEIIETADQLMFFQKSAGGHFTVLNKSNGAFIERSGLRDLSGFQGAPVSVEKWNEKLCILSYQPLSTGSTQVNYQLYMLDPITRQLTILASADGIRLESQNTPILVDSIHSKVYVTFKTRENGVYFLNFIEADLLEESYRIVKIESFSNTIDFFIYADIPLAKVGNILLIQLDKTFGFAGIRIADGSMIWTLPNSKLHPFTNDGKLYLIGNRKFQSIDPETGHQHWETSSSGFGDYGQFMHFHPDKAMAFVKANSSNFIRIIDLNDGTVLSQLAAPDTGDATFFVGNSIYLEDQDKVVVATDDFTVHCFKWPFK